MDLEEIRHVWKEQNAGITFKHGIFLWELPTLLMKKAIENVSTFPRYTEIDNWNLTFEVKMEQENEKFSVFLIEHGSKNNVNVERFNECVRRSEYSEKKQKELVKNFNDKINSFETWEFLLDNRPTLSDSNTLYRSYGDYLMSAEHYVNRKYMSDRYEESLYTETTDQHIVIRNNAQRYRFLYMIGTFEVKDGTLQNFYCENTPVMLAKWGVTEYTPKMELDNRLTYFLPDIVWMNCMVSCLAKIQEVKKILPAELQINPMIPVSTVREAMTHAATICVLNQKLCMEKQFYKDLFRWKWDDERDEAEKEYRIILSTAIQKGEEWERGGYKDFGLEEYLRNLSVRLRTYEYSGRRGFCNNAALVCCLYQLGTALFTQGQPDKAEPILAEAWSLTWKLQERMLNDETVRNGILLYPERMLLPWMLNLGRNFGMVKIYLAKFAEASDISENVLHMQGKYCAVPYTDEMLSVQAQLFGNAGISQIAIGKHEEGMFYMEKASKIYEELLAKGNFVSNMMYGLRYLSVLQMAVVVLENYVEEERKLFAKKGKELCENHQIFPDESLVGTFIQTFRCVLEIKTKKSFLEKIKRWFF